MMKEMGYDLRGSEGLNFGKGQRIPLQPFIPKEKPTNYYDQTRKGYPFYLIWNLKNLYHHTSQTHRIENLT